MNVTFQFVWLRVGLAIVLASGCAKESKKPKKPGTPAYNSSYADQYKSDSFSSNQNQSMQNAGALWDTNSNSTSIVIECLSANSGTLVVSQNMPVSWVFTARDASGTQAQSATFSFTASPQPTSFTSQGATVTFTPTQPADLSGTLNVTATVGSASNSRSFSWQSATAAQALSTNGTSGGGVFASMMGGLLGTLLVGNNAGVMGQTYGTNGYGYYNGYGNPAYGTPGYVATNPNTYNNNMYNNNNNMNGVYNTNYNTNTNTVYGTNYNQTLGNNSYNSMYSSNSNNNNRNVNAANNTYNYNTNYPYSGDLSGNNMYNSANYNGYGGFQNQNYNSNTYRNNNNSNNPYNNNSNGNYNYGGGRGW